MKVCLWRSSALLLVSFALLVSACSSDNSKKQDATFEDNPTAIPVSTIAAFPVTLQRSDGKPLTVAAPVKRVISLSPASTEIMYAIGAEASLVAVDSGSDYPAAAKAFTSRLDTAQLTVGAIIALTPDLVILDRDASGIVAELDAAKVPVLLRDAGATAASIDEAFGQIRILGQLTDRSNQAVDLINRLGARVQVVRDGLNGTNKEKNPTVYHERTAAYGTVSDASLAGDLYRILRVQNIAGDARGEPTPVLTSQTIITSNPRAIILADAAEAVTVDAVKARPGWDVIEAVKNNAIYTIDPALVGRAGPRIVDGLEQLAKYLYPTRFP